MDDLYRSVPGRCAWSPTSQSQNIHKKSAILRAEGSQQLTCVVTHMEFPHMGVPKNWWFIREIPIKNWWFGVPLFQAFIWVCCFDCDILPTNGKSFRKTHDKPVDGMDASVTNCQPRKTPVLCRFFVVASGRQRYGPTLMRTIGMCVKSILAVKLGD